MSEDARNATIIERIDLNPALFIIKVRPDSVEVPAFEPGQYISIGLPKPGGDAAATTPQRARPDAPQRVRLIRRPYSIASASTVRDHLELYVTLIENGRFTPRLAGLSVGDRIWMDERVLGDFTLEGVPPGKHFVFVSTGTGLAPFISMLRTYHGQDRWERVAILNGCRFSRDLGYHDELWNLQSRDARVVYHPIVTREPMASSWRGLRGRVQVILDEESFEGLVGWPLDPEECHVFLCGNPQMVDECEDELLSRGFKTHQRRDPGNLHLERYW